jgi:IclR family acetate operon transcriptional repressor
MGKNTDARARRASDASKAGRTIQSIERALDLLDILAASGSELALGEVAAKARLNTSTCHHLLATLVKRGYVGRNTRTRGYLLGPRIAELADRQLRQFRLVDVAMPELRRLNEATGESVRLAVLQGDALVVLAGLESRLELRRPLDERAMAKAAHATAIGKAILAWLPDAEVTRLIGNNHLKRFTENTVRTPPRLMEELSLVRRNGYARDDEEFQPGLVCIAAAIRDHAGAAIGSVGCSIPTRRAADTPLEAVKSAVKICAAAISERLGAARGVQPPD